MRHSSQRGKPVYVINDKSRDSYSNIIFASGRPANAFRFWFWPIYEVQKLNTYFNLYVWTHSLFSLLLSLVVAVIVVVVSVIITFVVVIVIVQYNTLSSCIIVEASWPCPLQRPHIPRYHREGCVHGKRRPPCGNGGPRGVAAGCGFDPGSQGRQMMMKIHYTIQYIVMRCDTIQYNTTQYNTIQNNTKQYNTEQYIFGNLLTTNALFSGWGSPLIISVSQRFLSEALNYNLS